MGVTEHPFTGPGLANLCKRGRTIDQAAATFTVSVEIRHEDGGLGAAAHVELAEQVRHVVLDRLLCQIHSLSDLTISQAFGKVIEEAAFLRAQVV